MALEDSLRRVESKQARRCQADTRDRFNQRTDDPEMVHPAVTPGIKERNNLARARVDRSDVTPLVPIADHAGIR